MTTPGPAMDDSPTVPRPPGAVEAVLAEHTGWFSERYDGPGTYYVICCDCGWEATSRGQDYGEHRAHVAQALVDAGCVLGDDHRIVLERAISSQAVEAVCNCGAVLNSYGSTVAQRFAAHLTATRTTAWKEAER